MTTHSRLPSEVEPSSIDELVADCECLENECQCSGVSLHPAHHAVAGPPAPVEFTDTQVALLDGYEDYGD
jgi:hypothetical protein